jgi:hypothetical protein
MRSLRNKTKINIGKSIQNRMKTNKVSHQKSESKQAIAHPLANIAGKFGGEFWLETQSEIERSRKTDRKEIRLM